MVREPMLKTFSKGVVNVHLGALPQYKGMDVVQAPVLDGCFDAVGMTAHLMTPKLDEGPVVSTFTTSSEGYSSLGSLRNEMSALSPLMSFDACLGLSSGRYRPIEQPKRGRQYFIVHDVLNDVISEVLAKRCPSHNAKTQIKTLVDALLPVEKSFVCD